MEDHNTSSSYNLINTIIGTYFKIFSEIKSLASLEAKLATESFIKIIILTVLATVVLISTWLSVLVLLFFYLISLHYSELISMAIIGSLNVLILLVMLVPFIKLKKNFSFAATRRQISAIKTSHKEANE